MLRTQSLLTYSIEDFLELREAAEICAVMDALAPEALRVPLGERGSIHGVTGLSTEEAVAIYEPEGRIEISPLPTPVLTMLDAAVERSRPDLQRAFPSMQTIGPWFYAEYGPGQYVTPHVDRMRNKAAPDHPKLGGISVLLDDGFTGGEFYVETCGSSEIWRPEEDEWIQVKGLTAASPWFLDTPRTRWTASQRARGAVIYGSQLVHGTAPVRSGRTRKVISWLNA